MNPDLQRLRAHPHLSVSQITCFTRCPRQWAFRYQYNRKPAFKPIALATGTAWHEAVGLLLHQGAGGGKTDLDEAFDVFCQVLDGQLEADTVPVLFEDEETIEDVRNKAATMLDAFVEGFPMPDEVLGLEVPFSIDLFDARADEPLTLPLIGALDAVVRYGEQAAVVEFKTAKRRWAQDALDTDIQLTAYKIAARQLGIDEPTLRLAVTTKTRRPDVQVADLVRHPRDEQEFVELAAGVLHAAGAGVDYRLRSWACKTCPFAMECAP